MEQIPIDPFIFYCENREEAQRIKQEIFTHHIYFFETENPAPVIIDAGAHIGLATLYFKKLYPAAQITAIEPHPASFKILQKNIAENYIEDVTLINAALSAGSGTEKTLYADTEFNWFSTASFHENAWNGSQKTASLAVPALSLTKVLENIGKPIDLLKIDIEGAEQSVLLEARNNLAKVAHIICEFHTTTNQNREQFITFLKAQGYTVTHEDKKERFHAPRQLEMIEAVRE